MSTTHGYAGNPPDWVDDFPHENGTYLHYCRSCGVRFIGHKRRVICKLCAEATP